MNSACINEGKRTGLTGRQAGAGRGENSERRGGQQGGSQVSVWMVVPWGGWESLVSSGVGAG